MKSLFLIITKIIILLSLSSLLLSTTSANTTKKQEIDLSNSSYIPITYTRLDVREEHIFLNPKESITYNAPLKMDDFHFTRTHTTIGASNPQFLREMTMDLFVETYNYWGENLGAWTDNNNFTLTNPKEETQELFLKINNRYSRRRYVTDNIEGNQHTITFKTDTPTDRVYVYWGFAAALKDLEVNGTKTNESDMISSNETPIMMEYTFRAASFRLPSPTKIENSTFKIVIEDLNLPERPNSPRINAWIYPETTITLHPNQQFDFQIPGIQGWSYSNAGFASNITPSMYPTPYPFEVTNLAIWNPQENPVSTTPTDMNFGIRNLSNQTYQLASYPTLYYWQNQTAIEYTHQTSKTKTAITHTYSVNISDTTVDSHLGLKGHYLTFGATGKTIKFDAPEKVGKFSNSYIPLKEGTYTLTTIEPKIEHNTSINTNDLNLTTIININVTYDQDPYANAKITINQKGIFTQKTYETTTNEKGQATITIYSGLPDIEELEIHIKKDNYNNITHIVNLTIGSLWIALIAITVLGTIIIVIYKYKTKNSST